MKFFLICVLLVLTMLNHSSFADASQTVFSPDQNIKATVMIKEKLDPYPAGERLYYSVEFKNRPLILESPFGLDFKNMPPLARDLKIKSSKQQTIQESWEPVWGKQKTILNHCNELSVSLEEVKPPHRTFDFIVRAFDDGVAFRYFLPEQEAFSDFELVAERSEFHFSDNYNVWAARYPNFRTHQETEYQKIEVNEIQAGEVIGCPLLVNAYFAWFALTEANLVDWAGMYFTGSATARNAVVSLFSPRLDDPSVLVRSKTPRYSPWRTIMIGERPGDLIESNIIINLADSCEITDTSWIQPGICAWDRWWCGSYAPDFNGRLTVDNNSMKYFIDFAAEMDWEYQLVDWFWYGPPFDPNKELGEAANTKVSILKPAEDIDIPELVEYAKKKGVKILVWLDWFHADKEMNEAFPLYEKWGVAGVKVDFMTRDDQEMVNFYHRCVKLAAKHHLTVDFHGAYKPTGFRRTYPNLLTREGVMGNEYNKWSSRITPTHNVTLPFTRMLCGPMDYTPGGFRNKTVSTFRIVGGDAPGPFVMTTRAQQLAMLVVYESPLQVPCDSPYNYRMSPAGLDFLKIVPTTWDDTKVLDGFPGEFIILARKKGTDWFVGAMNNETERSVTIPLDFLSSGKFKAKIWADPDEAADYPDRLKIEERTVQAKDQLEVKMAGGGGCVVHLTTEK